MIPTDVENQDQFELASFVPQLLLERLIEQAVGGAKAPADALFNADCVGAALFVDISGFTALTQRLAAEGPIGAERLTELLNRFFSLLIDIVAEHGGDVVDFSGDAILAFWVAQQGALHNAAAAAARCAMAILERADAYPADNETKLRIRVGLGFGAAHRMRVGRTGSVRKFVLAGEALAQIGVTTAIAERGQAVMTSQLRVLLPGSQAEPVKDGYFLLRAIDPAPPSPRRTLPTALAVQQPLRDYVVNAVLSQFDAGDTRWLAEFRPVSVIFINLPALDCSDRSGRALFQAAVLAVVDAVAPLEGDVLQVLVDDKGPVLEVVFGLPPRAHEEDALRAVRAALSAAEALRKLPIQFAMGITTGQAFCGTYGNAVRRHYAVVGSIVNMAARLMQHAAGRVLCDGATVKAVRRDLHSSQLTVNFSEAQAIEAKGLARPVKVYVPALNRTTAAPVGPAANRQQADAFVGRQSELKLFDSLLERTATLEPVTAVLQGEAGIGKTRLVQEVGKRAKAKGIRVLSSTAEAIEASTPYFAVRDLFLGWLQAADSDEQSVTERLIEKAGQLAPLLNVVLPIELPESAITRQMSGEIRADATRRLLLRLFLDRPDRVPVLVIVENLQWVDSVSWQLFRALIATQAPLGMVLVSRPFSDDAPVGFDQLCARQSVRLLELGALEGPQIGDLIGRTLGVREVDQALRRLVADRSEGHPLFARELTLSLRESGLLEVEHDRCRLRGGGERVGEVIPDTLQGVITSRLDRLANHRKLTVKLGSVVGRSFGSAILAGVHPDRRPKEAIPVQLDRLVDDEVLQRETEAPDRIYSFLHVLIRDVAYAQLPFAQRREFHSYIVDWLEHNSPATDRQSVAVLAHHSRHAELFEKCLGYLEQAGEQALADGANRECVSLFTRALRIVDFEPTAPEVSEVRRAHWEQRIGEAYYSAGDIEKSERLTRLALDRLDEALPQTDRQWVLRVVRELARQAWHALFRRRAPPRRDQTERITVAAQAYSVLGEQLYFKNAPSEWLGITLAAINSAEKIARTDVAGRAYGGLGYAMGVGRLDRVARRYIRLGGETENDIKARGIAYCGEGNWHIAFGRWQQADAVLEPGMELSRQASDQFSLGFARTIYGQGLDYRGALRRATKVFAELIGEAKAESNRLFLAWAHVDLAGSYLGLGNAERALTLLGQADQYVWDVDSFSDIRYHGVNAGAFWLLGDSERAWQHAVAALERLRGKTQFHQSFYWTYTGIADSLAGMVGEQSEANLAIDPELVRLAREGCANFNSLARIFPIMKSRAQRLSAKLDLHLGRPAAAARKLTRAVSLAERYGMTYDLGVAHWEWARLLHLPEFSRKSPSVDHAQRARQLLSEVGAQWHLERLD